MESAKETGHVEFGERDTEIYSLLSKIQGLAPVFSELGRAPDQATRRVVEALPAARKAAIEMSLRAHLEVHSDCTQPDIFPSDRIDGVEAEKSRLQRALKAFGMSAMDPEIFDLLDAEDIVEIYDSSGVQLYRNIAFCRICTYSLIELMSYPWSDLYEKPASVTQRINEVFADILTLAPKTLSYDIDVFVQKEMRATTRGRRAFLVKPKYISPCIDPLTGQRKGAISTYKGTVLKNLEASNRVLILSR